VWSDASRCTSCATTSVTDTSVVSKARCRSTLSSRTVTARRRCHQSRRCTTPIAVRHTITSVSFVILAHFSAIRSIMKFVIGAITLVMKCRLPTNGQTNAGHYITCSAVVTNTPTMRLRHRRSQDFVCGVHFFLPKS